MDRLFHTKSVSVILADLVFWVVVKSTSLSRVIVVTVSVTACLWTYISFILKYYSDVRLELIRNHEHESDITHSRRLTDVLRRVRKIAKSDYYLRHTCPSVCLSAWNNSAPTGRIIVKFYIYVFFESLVGEFKFDWNLGRITGTLHENLCAFMIFRWVTIWMGSVSDISL
jgi:hypothetical protein